MRRGESGQNLISALFDTGLLDPASARVVPVDKDWMVAGKMVDLLWEPHTNDSNTFCASGVHRQIASALQRQGPTEAGPEVWERWRGRLSPQSGGPRTRRGSLSLRRPWGR